MGNLENRLSRLEGRIQPLEAAQRSGEAQQLEREAIIAELERLERERGPLREVAEREAEAGFPQRLRALQELEVHVRKRLALENGE
jgi:hypothetical protein